MHKKQYQTQQDKRAPQKHIGFQAVSQEIVIKYGDPKRCAEGIGRKMTAGKMFWGLCQKRQRKDAGKDR